MGKTIKLKNDIYLDSSSVIHNKKALSKFIVGEGVEFRADINVAEANTWYDTGIEGPDLVEGTYIMQAFISGGNAGINEQYSERLSGVVAWYSVTTNSKDADEIPLSKNGHARNNHDIKLRIARQVRSEGHCKLQISDSIAWNGTENIAIKFRKII